MSWLKFVVAASCVWGSVAFANTTGSATESSTGPRSERQELRIISSWMAHLNHYFPEIHLQAQGDLQDPQAQQETLDELGALEEVLQIGRNMPDGSLMHIACDIRCGGPGSGDGKCFTCKNGKN